MHAYCHRLLLATTAWAVSAKPKADHEHAQGRRRRRPIYTAATLPVIKIKERSLKGCLQSAECRKSISNGQLEQAFIFLQSAFLTFFIIDRQKDTLVSIPSSVTRNHGPLVYLSLHYCLFFWRGSLQVIKFRMS
jgi:hypothetical protein